MTILREATTFNIEDLDNDGGTISTANAFTETVTGSAKARVQVTFVAPASGRVMVLFGLWQVVSSASTTYTAIATTAVRLDGPGQDAVFYSDHTQIRTEATQASAAGATSTQTRSYMQTGLQPGRVYTLTMVHKTNATTVTAGVDSRILLVTPVEPI